MSIISFIKKLFNNETETFEEYVLPGRYMNFPVYPGIMKGKPIEKSTEKYERLTIYYKGSINKDFIKTIKEYGYEEATDVRYDKDHTYIIVEREGGKTKIAYHIKKN